MKKTILYLLTLLFLASCNNQVKKEKILTKEDAINKTVRTDFIKTFEGSINSKYEILMKINSNDGIINGNYFYKSQKRKIQIKGKLNVNGEIVLNEFDNRGNQTGLFQGRMPNENKIIGNWSKPNGANEMSFSLIESNTNFENSMTSIQKTIINEVSKLNITGSYKKVIENGEINIMNVKSSGFKFKIKVISNNGNFGEIEGTASLKNNIGIYKKNGCQINFKFDENEIIITEKRCENEKGAGVYFSGNYKK
jgi:hypothetical protein